MARGPFLLRAGWLGFLGVLVETAMFVLALTAALFATQPKPMGSPVMDILSAPDTISTCLRAHSGLAERRAECVGQFAEACMTYREGGQTTVGMMQCSMEEAEAWDAQLNTAYQTLRDHYQGQSAYTAIQEAQRAWISFRDTDCAYMASIYEGGSIATVIHSGCVLDKTAHRALDLMEQTDLPD